MSEARPGTVYLVGAGPGDPGLLTVRGRELLDSCEAVVYDALVNPRMLPGGDRAPALYFVGKRGRDEASAKQGDINALLVRLAGEGRSVVRLKGGDPFVFGRGSEEAVALAAAGLPFEIVPGVTAGVAAAAYAGIPVTHRGVATAVTFVTGHEDPTKPDTQTDWAALAKAGGTIVLYMGVGRLRTIAAALVAGGMASSTPAAAVQWGTMAAQRTVVGTVGTLADDVAAAGLDAPVITVIGEAVRLREEIAWFDRRPLFGRRILVTRAAAQAGSLSERLREVGADVVEMPATRIETVDTRALAEAIAHLGDYQHLVLTSQNAVRVFWETLRASGRDARSLAGLRVSVVGAATAEALLGVGIAADVVPDRYAAEGLLDALDERVPLAASTGKADKTDKTDKTDKADKADKAGEAGLAGTAGVRGERILYPAAEGAREVLAEGLRAMGATVDVIVVYRSVADGQGADEVRRAVAAGEVDLVTFTSASTVRGFVDAVGAELAVRVPAAVIGPITSDAARAAGIDVVVESPVATIAGLVDAILAARAAQAGQAAHSTAQTGQAAHSTAQTGQAAHSTAQTGQAAHSTTQDGQAAHATAGADVASSEARVGR